MNSGVSQQLNGRCSVTRSYDQVVHRLHGVSVSDGDIVTPELVPRALTAGELLFTDRATQVFEADGGTTYIENGRPPGVSGPSTRVTSVLSCRLATAPATSSAGSSRTALIVGLRFTELGRGSQFEGRYRVD